VAEAGVDELLGRPVRHRGIVLGRAVDAIVDERAGRVLGLDVLCGDGEHRFLPLAAAVVRPAEIGVGSPLLLLDGRELDFYASRSATFRSLQGRPVLRRRAKLGKLVDLLLGIDGAIDALVVTGEGRMRVPWGNDVTLGAARPHLRTAS
jgi:hypothetical protein